MRYQDLVAKVREIMPDAIFDEDSNGEITISTGFESVSGSPDIIQPITTK